MRALSSSLVWAAWAFIIALVVAALAAILFAAVGRPNVLDIDLP